MFYSIIHKTIAIGVLNLVAFTYGNKGVDLSVKSSQISTMDALFKELAIGEEEILAFILGEDYANKDKCKAGLETYCNELKEIDPKFDKVHTKIKEICNGNIQQKCQDLNKTLGEKLESFFKEFVQLAKNKTAGFQICNEFLQRCFFLDKADQRTDGYCATIKHYCIYKDRSKEIDEIFIRALGNTVTNKTNFKEKMKEVCPILIQQSTGFFARCLYVDLFFEELKNYTNYYCSSSNLNLSGNELQKECHEGLKQCPFLQNECEKCGKLKKLCEGKNITYNFPMKGFNPIEAETLLGKIDFEDFYIEQKNKGIDFLNFKITLEEMLFAINSGNGSFDETQCKEKLKENCDYYQHLTFELKEACKDNGERICKDVAGKTHLFDRFIAELYVSGLSSGLKSNTGKYQLLNSASEFIDRGKCVKFLFGCNIMQGKYRESITGLCANLMLLCFEKSQDYLLIKSIGSQLRQEKYELKPASEKLKICQKVVLENCVALGNNNNWNFPKCLRPKKICHNFEKILLIQSRDLGQALDEVRDSPKKRDCNGLEKDCDGIVGNLGSNNEKCATLKKNCEYLRAAKELKNELLKEKSNALASVENCVKALKEKCDRLFNEEGNPFLILCIFKEETCKRIVSEVSNHCNAFKDNIKKQGIVNRSKNENKTLKQETCTLWVPYCDQLMGNCPDKLKEGNGNGKGACLELKENCKPIIDRLHLENALAYQLKGSLTDEAKCKGALEKYCAQRKEERNNTFDSLCNKNDPKNNVEELCKKLVGEVRNKCPALKNDLEKREKDLEKKKSNFEKVKKEAEESIKEAKLALSKVKGEGQDAGVSEAEANAFDATARALELYLELKEDCKGLQLDCGFTKECPDSKEFCEKIDTLCKGVKPLEIKYHYGGKVTEQCTFSQTIDTWVTSTSLHTSTTTSTSTITSTVTLTSTRKCKPTKCTTDSSKETQKEEDVKPNAGMKIRISEMIKIMLLGTIIMGIL